MYGITRNSRGFTLIEMVIVVLLFGIMAAVAVPRAMRVTPQQQVHQAARQVMRDLEAARMRAISAKRVVRVSFNISKEFYAAFMDVTPERQGDIQETQEEARASRFLARASEGGIPGGELGDRVSFGFGNASAGPLGEASGDPVILSDDRVEFDARGMVRPVAGVRTGGAIFLTHEDDPSVVSAVTITGSGAFRTWDYRDGKWR
jgi:prepilin-type N-terminal cleavage/methylation domain-containing protein